MGRIVAVKVEPDQLVRTCLFRYSLVQNMNKEERTSYKGVTVKHIRVAIQRLVVILPQEEQENIRPITQEETMAAFAEVACQEKDHGHRVLKSVTNPLSSNLICSMLRYRSEFESWFGEDDQAEQNRFANIIVNHGGKGMICGMCEHCR